MSKTFYKAYQLGQKDGTSGQNKLASRSFMRMFTNIGSYLPGSANRDDEWIKGYRSGFDDSVRTYNVRSQVGNFNINNSTNMDTLDEGAQFNVRGNSQQKGGGGGMSKVNDWDYQLGVAGGLLRATAETAIVVDEVKNKLNEVVYNHGDLMQGNFRMMCDHFLEPLIRDFENLKLHLTQSDQPEIHKIISGLSAGKASKYGTAVQANTQNIVASILGAVGSVHLGSVVTGGQTNDLYYQLSIVENLIRIMETAKSTVDNIGRTYNQCVQAHDDLMVQYFKKFVINCLDPRMQEFRVIYHNIEKALIELNEQRQAILNAINAY